MKRWTIPLGVLVTLGVGVAAAGYWGFHSARPAASQVQAAPPTVAAQRGTVSLGVTAPGRLVGTRETVLSFGATEAALAQLKSPDAAAQQHAHYALETAKNSLWSAQVARDAACGGPDKVACDQGQAAVGNADAAVRKAQDDLARIQAGPNADELRVAEANVERARGRLAQVRQQTGENDVRAAQLAHEQVQARLNELSAGPNAVDLRQAQAELKAATLVAPYAGVVLEVKASEGETVANGAPVLRLSDPTQLEAEITVVEEDFPLVKVGQKVELFFDAMPEAAVTGRVARIVPQRSATAATPVYPVYIALDEVRPELAPGMTVDASVLIDVREDVLRLPRSLVRTRADGTATLKMWNGVSTEERTVQVGLRGNQYVEILSGLAQGDQVVSR